MGTRVNGALPPMLLKSHETARAAVDPHGQPPCAECGSRQSSSTGQQAPSIPLIDVVKDALIRHFGSLKAAAYELGMDQGQMSRDLQTGDFKFRKLEGKHGDAVKRLIAEGMARNYGDDDPRTRRRRVIRIIRERLDELVEIEDVA